MRRNWYGIVSVLKRQRSHHLVLWDSTINFLFIKNLLRFVLWLLLVLHWRKIFFAELTSWFFIFWSTLLFFSFNRLIELDDFIVKISVFLLFYLNSWQKFDFINVVPHLLNSKFHLISEDLEFYISLFRYIKCLYKYRLERRDWFYESTLCPLSCC